MSDERIDDVEGQEWQSGPSVGIGPIRPTVMFFAPIRRVVIDVAGIVKTATSLFAMRMIACVRNGMKQTWTTLVNAEVTTPVAERLCNRKVCRQPYARWYNTSTRAFYCEGCAKLINEHNPGLCIEHVDVDIFSHPSWDMKLILESTEWSTAQALENLSEQDDASLLHCEGGHMPIDGFQSLPEFDG